jgi:hypothetical protein
MVGHALLVSYDNIPFKTVRRLCNVVCTICVEMILIYLLCSCVHLYLGLLVFIFLKFGGSLI